MVFGVLSLEVSILWVSRVWRLGFRVKGLGLRV